MLILTRKPGESILLETSDGTVEVIVLGMNKGQLSIGFEAPDCVDILRSELVDKLRE